MKKQLTDKQFRSLLNLMMCADPWPVELDCGEYEIIEDLLDAESRLRDYDNWVVAFHEIKPYLAAK